MDPLSATCFGVVQEGGPMLRTPQGCCQSMRNMGHSIGQEPGARPRVFKQVELGKKEVWREGRGEMSETKENQKVDQSNAMLVES